MAELDRRIDLVALGVFDIYMGYRGQVCELRINEVKRSVAMLTERMGLWPLRADDGRVPLGPSECDEPQQGGGP